ncbi:Uncharacterised protein [Chlamydia trachomatis]|nr:Uncharacterised protein [Chlamydia trachomatis]
MLKPSLLNGCWLYVINSFSVSTSIQPFSKFFTLYFGLEDFGLKARDASSSVACDFSSAICVPASKFRLTTVCVGASTNSPFSLHSRRTSESVINVIRQFLPLITCDSLALDSGFLA